jgi:2-polyprenyl-3-methyl-5-hydroxy-6-metoxy-1,4-benzoquinol methylase
VLRRVVRLARADGHTVEAVGVDPDERALEVACSAPAVPGVTFRRAHSRDLVEEGARFDVVISNHVLHHLTDAQRADVFADSERLASGVVVHSDIARSVTAYAAYAVGITPFAPGTFLRTDGLRSIRRSHTRAELAALVPPGWSVERGPFRVLAVHRPSRGAA